MKYSIITVCRNDLQGLKNTFNSIISQTCNDYEWIVIDGDSKDGTKEWLNELPKSYKWISENDSGLYNAMNKGIELASGEYLVFMNSGDTFADSNVLEVVLEATKKHPSFIYGDSIDVTSRGEQYYRKARSHTVLWKCMFTHHQSMYFDKSSLKSIRYNEKYKYSADYAFVCEFMKDKYKNDNKYIVRINIPACKFLLGGLNFRKRVNAIFEEYKIRKNVLGQSIVINLCLLLLHYLHFILKVYFPKIPIALRYKNINEY